MIKFFRKIRYNSMETGKTTKYLKYAIGEIILVVIGILIALQINNWNEQRKIQLSAQTYIDKIINDLSVDTLNINALITKSDTYEKNITDYFNAFDLLETTSNNTDNLIDSINNITAFYIKYYPINQAFKNMESSENRNLLNEVQRDFLIALASKQDELEIINESIINRANDELQYSGQLLGEPSGFYNKFKIENTIERKIQGLLHLHLSLKAMNQLYFFIELYGKQIKELSHEAIILLKQSSHD